MECTREAGWAWGRGETGKTGENRTMRVPGRPLAGFSAFWKSQRGTERGFFAVTGSFVFLCSGAQSSRSPQEAWAVSPSASQGWGGLGAGTERACDGLGPEPGPPQALGGLSGISCARTRGRKDLPWLGRLGLLSGKESTCQFRRHRFDSWVGRSPGDGNGNPSCSPCGAEAVQPRSS